ncbi:MAG: hypothetical protein MI919_07040 [Holophagales bacterium]|nr:hypothetical protein [Holophagales bacterium]
MKGHFFASLAFALVAGLAVVPWLILIAPVVGSGTALAFLMPPAVAAYTCLIAPSWRTGIRAGLAGAALAGLPLLLTASLETRLLGAALTLALIRSGWLFRRRGFRTVAVELALAAAGLLLAAALAGGTVLGWGLATWTFFLIQSLYFLIADVEPRSEATSRDPFERARDRALAVLDGSV